MWINDIIQRAMDNGEFDDLPGHGKPLNLNQDRHTPPELRTAYRIMQEAGVPPAWISERKDIDAAIDKAHQDLAQAHQWYKRQGKTASATAAWQRAQRTFRTRAEEVNKRILTYNLKAPAASVQLRPINVEKELAAYQ